MKHVLYFMVTAAFFLTTLTASSTCTTRWDQWLKRYVTTCDTPKQTCITTWDQWLKVWKTVCK